MRRLLLLVAVLCRSAALFAQNAPQQPWATLSIKSRTLGDTRTIYVATPAGYADVKRRFPTLVLLDAGDQDQFNAAVGNLRFLAGRGAIPEFILVGIVSENIAPTISHPWPLTVRGSDPRSPEGRTVSLTSFCKRRCGLFARSIEQCRSRFWPAIRWADWLRCTPHRHGVSLLAL